MSRRPRARENRKKSRFCFVTGLRHETVYEEHFACLCWVRITRVEGSSYGRVSFRACLNIFARCSKQTGTADTHTPVSLRADTSIARLDFYKFLPRRFSLSIPLYFSSFFFLLVSYIFFFFAEYRGRIVKDVPDSVLIRAPSHEYRKYEKRDSRRGNTSVNPDYPLATKKHYRGAIDKQVPRGFAF